MDRPKGLDDRRLAAFAWARYRRILRIMALGALLVALLVAGYLWWSSGPLPWLFLLFTMAGIWTTIMMAAALMGLMFLSSGTGHDEIIEDRAGEHYPLDD